MSTEVDAYQMEQEVVQQIRSSRDRIDAELSKVIIGQKDVIEQLLIALFSGGHCLITGAPGLAKTLLVRTIAHPSIAFASDPATADIEALLFTGPPDQADRLRRTLAARDGAIVPLLQDRADGSYDLTRLVVEKVASINTTAAGGNASLMSLAGE